MKTGDEGTANASLKSTETRDELSTTCIPKVKMMSASIPSANEPAKDLF